MSEIAVDNGLLLQVDRNVRVAINNIGIVANQVEVLENNLSKAQERIKRLQAFVTEMRTEQKKSAALQKALTEIVRVRQELEQKFGSYQLVRDSMIGILQANDHALVTQSTISRVSEELMISTPQYWLAPCVIAISAWISNDPDLARRAVDEALSRDAEKTSLLMALICRRSAAVSERDATNDAAALERMRFDASQEWLKFYFDCQDPNNISRSVLLFVNAYVNGVFGENTNQLVENIIQNKWIPALEESNPNFKKEQLSTWNGYFDTFLKTKCTPAQKKYPNLAKYADKQDFLNISAYADRIDVSDNFIEGYFKEINNQSVDKNNLVKIIDEDYLRSLVTDFDEAERPLREEEALYQIIKDKDGDEKEAQKAIRAQAEKKAHLNKSIDLVQYLNATVAGKNENDGVVHDASEKKTALKFTAAYIQESYDNFIDAKKDSFPSTVKISVEGVRHNVTTAADSTAFSNAVKTHLEKERDTKKAAVKPLGGFAFAAILAVIAVICFANYNALLGVLAIAGAAGIAFYNFNNAKKKKSAIDAEYTTRINAALACINATIKEWEAVSSTVQNFNSKPRFNVENAN